MGDTKNSVLRSSVRKRERALLCSVAAERLDEMLSQIGMVRADLARRLDTSRANVTQLLSGRRNLTLHTLADLAAACRYRVRLSLRPALDLWVSQSDPWIIELKAVGRRAPVQDMGGLGSEGDSIAASLQLGVAP